MDSDEAFNDVRDTLWFLLACRCERCGCELDLSEYDPLRDRDPQTWSRLAADRAMEAGWTASASSPAMRCPACSSS